MKEEIQKFVIFCLESYKIDKQLSGAEALRDFEQYDVISYLEDGFEVLHTQGREYIVVDINDYIHRKQNTKWFYTMEVHKLSINQN